MRFGLAGFCKGVRYIHTFVRACVYQRASLHCLSDDGCSLLLCFAASRAFRERQTFHFYCYEIDGKSQRKPFFTIEQENTKFFFFITINIRSLSICK